MKEKIKIIDVAEVIAPILSSRDVVNNNLEQLIIKSSTTKINLDFQKVKFVSRSAADELLKLKEKLKDAKEIQFINTNDAVAQILKIVESTRALPKRKIPKLKIETINIVSLMR